MIRHILSVAVLMFCMGAPVQAQFASGVASPAPSPRLAAVELEQRCSGGNAVACDDLGMRYLKGDGLVKDARKAATLFQKACDGGDAPGCFDLAESYRFGDGVAKDLKAAAAFYLRACDGKLPNGCAELAIIYAYGAGVQKDEPKAALYADRGCKGGSQLGCAILGGVYAEGVTGYPKDVARAQKLLTQACFKDADFKRTPDDASQVACPALAKLTGKPACTSLSGTGASADRACHDPENRAWQLSGRPAAPDRPPTAAAPPPNPTVTSNAAVNAGNAAYARRDFTKAAGQFALACDAGNASACGALGDMYVKGEGVSASGARAAGPLAKACDAGIVASCGKLGVLYDVGNGVSANKARAFTLFNGACSRSDMASCYNLGRLYESGQGAALNVAQAAALYQQTCSAGIADGCYSVGTLYERGAHFTESKKQAEYFYNMGCARGSSTGCKYAAIIKNERDSNQRFALQQENQRRLSSNNPGKTSNSNPTNPADCYKVFVPPAPGRGTYTECDRGECKTYYQDSVSQHADDGLYYLFNSPKRRNVCTRSITVYLTYDKTPQWYPGATVAHILEDEHKTLSAGEQYFPKYIDPIVQKVTWAN